MPEIYLGLQLQLLNKSLAFSEILPFLPDFAWTLSCTSREALRREDSPRKTSPKCKRSFFLQYLTALFATQRAFPSAVADKLIIASPVHLPNS